MCKIRIGVSGGTDPIVQRMPFARHRRGSIASAAWEELRLTERQLALRLHRPLRLLAIAAAVYPEEVLELLREGTVPVRVFGGRHREACEVSLLVGEAVVGGWG